MRAYLMIVLLLVACPGGSGTGDRVPPPVAPADAAPAATVSADAAGQVAVAPPDASRACPADMAHCCMPDGRIVTMGRCQPVNRAGDPPAVTRNADGTCEPIKCLIRCLPAQARIATPRGEVPVASLAMGDMVWTLDAGGQRVAAPIVRVSSVAAPGHTLTELRLADGRVMRASAGHPTQDGRLLGDLAAGDRLDGARVVGVTVVPYEGERTWDLLPAGATGVYWSDGVLLASTLAP